MIARPLDARVRLGLLLGNVRLQELAQQENSADSAMGFRIEAVKQDDWTITIDTRAAQKESGE